MVDPFVFWIGIAAVGFVLGILIGYWSGYAESESRAQAEARWQQVCIKLIDKEVKEKWQDRPTPISGGTTSTSTLRV